MEAILDHRGETAGLAAMKEVPSKGKLERVASSLEDSAETMKMMRRGVLASLLRRGREVSSARTSHERRLLETRTRSQS